MNDAQLKLMLSAMLDDLEHTLDDVRALMPDEAEREGRWVKKKEFEGKVTWLISEATHELVNDGEHLALAPLAEWIARWHERLSHMEQVSE